MLIAASLYEVAGRLGKGDPEYDRVLSDIASNQSFKLEVKAACSGVERQARCLEETTHFMSCKLMSVRSPLVASRHCNGVLAGAKLATPTPVSRASAPLPTPIATYVTNHLAHVTPRVPMKISPAATLPPDAHEAVQEHVPMPMSAKSTDMKEEHVPVPMSAKSTGMEEDLSVSHEDRSGWSTSISRLANSTESHHRAHRPPTRKVATSSYAADEMRKAAAAEKLARRMSK